MRDDILNHFTPFVINFSDCPNHLITAENGFKLFKSTVSINDILGEADISNVPLTYTKYLYDTISNYIANYILTLRTQLARELLKRVPVEEQTVATSSELLKRIIDTGRAGHFIVIDNTPNTELNKLLSLWAREEGFKIIYPTYTYEKNFSDMVTKQYIALSEVDDNCSFIC